MGERERVNITNDVMTDDPRPTTARVVLKRPPPTQCHALDVISWKCISVAAASAAGAAPAALGPAA